MLDDEVDEVSKILLALNDVDNIDDEIEVIEVDVMQQHIEADDDEVDVVLWRDEIDVNEWW